MPATLYDQYAAKICRTLNLGANTYEPHSLNTTIMSLPLAEAHAALDGRELADLPRLGDSVPLNDHMRANFFDVIGLPSREIIEFTKPFLIRRNYLERLEGWRDWRTLTVYLNQEGLDPVMVFRNTPIPLSVGPYEKSDFYVADIRVRFIREVPFVWNG